MFTYTPLYSNPRQWMPTAYDVARAQMKVIVISPLSAAADVFRLLGVILEA